MNLLLSPAALQDIEQIDDFTSDRWGVAQAARYVQGLYFACDRIVENPTIGRQRPDVAGNRRIVPVGRHLVIYEIDERNERIKIVRILHQSMDVVARLRDD